jgi:DNA-binding response OmpR family regulator
MDASIIVVSADEDVRRRSQALLCEQGYLVETAASFVEGQARLESAMPDVLITELRLDDDNGLELAAHSRLYHPDVAVIITSASDDSWAEGEAKRHGADFIPGPIENPDFLPCVRTALAKRRSLEDPRRRWLRNPVAGVPVHAANARAQIVDLSCGGVRLAFDGLRVIPQRFDITLPGDGVTVQARCVWTDSAADRQFHCGAEVMEDPADSWREFVVRTARC